MWFIDSVIASDRTIFTVISADTAEKTNLVCVADARSVCYK